MSDVNYVQSVSSEILVNNKKVDSKKLDLDYDGDDMNISGHINNKHFKKKISNKNILKLLATPCRKISLVDQLKRDFPLSSKKKSKSQRNKKKSKKFPTKTRRHSEGGDGPTNEPAAADPRSRKFPTI